MPSAQSLLAAVAHARASTPVHEPPCPIRVPRFPPSSNQQKCQIARRQPHCLDVEASRRVSRGAAVDTRGAAGRGTHLVIFTANCLPRGGVAPRVRAMGHPRVGAGGAARVSRSGDPSEQGRVGTRSGYATTTPTPRLAASRSSSAGREEGRRPASVPPRLLVAMLGGKRTEDHSASSSRGSREHCRARLVRLMRAWRVSWQCGRVPPPRFRAPDAVGWLGSMSTSLPRVFIRRCLNARRTCIAIRVQLAYFETVCIGALVAAQSSFF
jgi:hypothetical protein